MRLDRFKVEEFLQEPADKVEYSAYCPECDDDAEFDFEIGVKDGAVIQFVQEWFEGTRKEAGFLIDNPELDATDGAHPAWWRGHDHAVAALCQKINEIFDGKDNGEGVSGEPWEGVRCKLRNAAALIRIIEKAEKDGTSSNFFELLRLIAERKESHDLDAIVLKVFSDGSGVVRQTATNREVLGNLFVFANRSELIQRLQEILSPKS